MSAGVFYLIFAAGVCGSAALVFVMLAAACAIGRRVQRRVTPLIVSDAIDDEFYDLAESNFRAGHPHGVETAPGSGLPSQNKAVGSQPNSVVRT